MLFRSSNAFLGHETLCQRCFVTGQTRKVYQLLLLRTIRYNSSVLHLGLATSQQMTMTRAYLVALTRRQRSVAVNGKHFKKVHQPLKDLTGPTAASFPFLVVANQTKPRRLASLNPLLIQQSVPLQFGLDRFSSSLRLALFQHFFPFLSSPFLPFFNSFLPPRDSLFVPGRPIAWTRPCCFFASLLLFFQF